MYISRLLNLYRSFCKQFMRFMAPIIIDGWYGSYWKVRDIITNDSDTKNHPFLHKLVNLYHADNGFWIGEHSSFESIPIFPHGLSGIFISDIAKIGKNVVIFQQVTIGSNTLKGHPRCGAPTIGNNVYIGAGAKIIGNIRIGDNCRIGANCVVVKDLPANSTAVLGESRIIISKEKHDNDFISGIKLRQNIQKEQGN